MKHSLSNLITLWFVNNDYFLFYFFHQFKDFADQTSLLVPNIFFSYPSVFFIGL